MKKKKIHRKLVNRKKRTKPKGTNIRICSRNYTYKKKHTTNRSIEEDGETSIEGTT